MTLADYKGFFADPIDAQRHVYSKRPEERDWHFNARLKAVREDIKIKMGKKYFDPVFRDRLIWLDDFQKAKIVVKLVGGTKALKECPVCAYDFPDNDPIMLMPGAQCRGCGKLDKRTQKAGYRHAKT